MSDRALFERSTCAALVITCSDFRFKHAERAFADAAGLGRRLRPDRASGRHPLACAAAQRGVADEHGGGDRAAVAAASLARVLMVNHLSCRAYDDIATAANEREIHAQHLAAAAKVVEGLVEGAAGQAYVVELGDARALAVVAL